MAFKVYPVVIVTFVGLLLIGFTELILGRSPWQGWLGPGEMGVESVETAPPFPTQEVAETETLSRKPQPSALVTDNIPAAEADPTGAEDGSELLSPLAQDGTAFSLPTPIPAGGLRVSNQTEYPIRVTLLAQTSQAPAPRQFAYSDPVHWDFAPEEGSKKGLILSLPEADLQLQEGDVLVAFAQDGSRRYWGPYVIGKTVLPIWNSTVSEWQLILQP